MEEEEVNPEQPNPTEEEPEISEDINPEKPDPALAKEVPSDLKLTDDSDPIVPLVEDEDATLEYLLKYLNLAPDDPILEEFKGLSQILHTLLSTHPLITLTLTSAYLKQMVENSAEVIPTFTSYLALFTPENTIENYDWASHQTTIDSIMPTILSTISNDLLEKFPAENEGKLSLQLLGHLVHLKDQHVDTRLCLSLLELTKNEELQKKEAGNSKSYLNIDHVTSYDPEDVDKVNQLLSILERYALIKLEENEEAHAPAHAPAHASTSCAEGRACAGMLNQKEIMELTLDLEVRASPAPPDLLNNNGVHVDPTIQKYVKLTQKEGQDWSFVLNLVQLLRREGRSPHFEPHFIPVHNSLKDFGWPQKSYRHSLFFGAALCIWLRSPEAARRILKNIYEYFMTDHAQCDSAVEQGGEEKKEEEETDGCGRDMEYFNLCRMILVYLENVEDELKSGKNHGGDGEEERHLDEDMDNSELFREVDYLYRIKSVEFFDWVVRQGMQFGENELIQHLAAQLLLIPMAMTCDPNNGERKKRRIKWINKYCQNLCQNGETRDRVFGLLDTPLKVMKIAIQSLPAVRVMQLAVGIVKAELQFEGATKSSWFLQELLYLMKPSPLSVWEVEHTAQCRLGMRGVCKMFVEQGLDVIFLGMLTELEEMYSSDHCLHLHFRDFLEAIKAAAYFEGCVRRLLKSSEFFLKMRKIFRLIIEGLEENQDDDPGNIKAACHILVFWYALISNSDSIQNAVPAHAFIREEMENFYQKVSHKESPIAIAFEGEKHWHIYYREQEETTKKILDNFLSTRDEGSAGDLYRLAKILKDTMSRKKDWWLMTYAVVATTTSVKSRSRRQTHTNDPQVDILVTADPDQEPNGEDDTGGGGGDGDEEPGGNENVEETPEHPTADDEGEEKEEPVASSE